jgi:chloramphenicol 3-O phosphotransferase
LDRERIRGDRRIGEGRAHVELNGIHAFGLYDFEIDTTAGVNTQTIASVQSAWKRRAPSPGPLAWSTQNR